MKTPIEELGKTRPGNRENCNEKNNRVACDPRIDEIRAVNIWFNR